MRNRVPRARPTMRGLPQLISHKGSSYLYADYLCVRQSPRILHWCTPENGGELVRRNEARLSEPLRYDVIRKSVTDSVPPTNLGLKGPGSDVCLMPVGYGERKHGIRTRSIAHKQAGWGLLLGMV